MDRTKRRMARRHWMIWLLGTVWTVGCPARHADFRPIEGPAALGQGHAAVYYDVEVEGRLLGEVRVWSPGGYRADVNGTERALHIQLRIRNDSDQTLALNLERTHVELATGDVAWVMLEEEARIDGPTQAAPRTTARVGLFYVLPSGVRPRDVNAFELNWHLDTEVDAVVRTTPFVRDRRGEDPDRWYWRPYWGYGWGPGFRGHPYWWYW